MVDEYDDVHRIEYCTICNSSVVFEGPVIHNGKEVHEYDICDICGERICVECQDYELMRILDAVDAICTKCASRIRKERRLPSMER